DVFRRLHDDGQAVDHRALRDQHVANRTQAGDALVVIAVTGDIDDLPAAGELLVEAGVAEQQRLADQRVDPDPRALLAAQPLAELVHRSGVVHPHPGYHDGLLARPGNEGDGQDRRVELVDNS